MKKMFLVAVITVFMTGCSNEQKSKYLIKDYLKTNLDDYSSYQSVEFSNLIADSSSFYDDETYKYLDLKQKSLEVTLGIMTYYDEDIPSIDTVDVYGKKTNYYDTLLTCMKMKSDFSSKYKPKHTGWIMGHVYRAKKDGNLKLYKGLFHIDKNYEKIISVKYEK